jgi:hypothetical protein
VLVCGSQLILLCSFVCTREKDNSFVTVISSLVIVVTCTQEKLSKLSQLSSISSLSYPFLFFSFPSEHYDDDAGRISEARLRDVQSWLAHDDAEGGIKGGIGGRARVGDSKQPFDVRVDRRRDASNKQWV